MSGLDTWIEDIDTNELMRTKLRYCSIAEGPIDVDPEKGCVLSKYCVHATGEKCFPKH